MVTVEIHQTSRHINGEKKRVRVATAKKIADVPAVPRIGDYLDHAPVTHVGFFSNGDRTIIVLQMHQADYDSDVDSQIRQWQELGYTVTD